ncbi:MAG: flagellar assembly protein FliW [Sphingobacteriia bacterium]|nr:flagellar assembly protein FliW [Sphingobacteriia bacterium]
MGNNVSLEATNKSIAIEEVKFESITTRFGAIQINKEKNITFPLGILGIEGVRSYCLADYPENKFPNFKVLQSLDDLNISFLVNPVTDFKIFDKKDLEECLNDLNIAQEELAIVLITSIHKNVGEEKARITVNMRAPIMIDTKNYVAYQYVFKNDNYSLQHEIN